MDLWHAHAIRWQFSCSQHKTLATCHSRRVSPRRGPVYDRDVDVHIGRKTVFPMSKALVTSFLAISFHMIFLSSLLSAYTKNSVSFEAKSNFNPFSSHMWKMNPFEELVPTKKFVKDFTFGSGCTVQLSTSRVPVSNLQANSVKKFSRGRTQLPTSRHLLSTFKWPWWHTPDYRLYSAYAFFFFFFYSSPDSSHTLWWWIVEYSRGETSTLCRPEVSASPCV